eukprot:g142.t1
MVERPVRISVKRLLEEESAASVMFSSLATGLTSGLNTAQQAAAGAASTASWSRVGLGAGLGGLSESLGGAAKLGTNMKTALNFWQAGEVEGSEQEEVPARAGGGSRPLGMELYMVKDNSMSPPMDETNDHRGLHRKPARFFVKSVSSDAGCASARTGIRPEDELIQIDEGPVNFDDLGNLTMALDNLRPVNCRFLRKVPLSDGAGGTSARTTGDTDSEQRYLMARQMADHWERECKQSHAHCVQLTTDFNQLIEEHETMEEAQGQFKARVMELEDMNIKWQARYEKQEKEVERLRKWVAEHGEDAQRLAEMEEGVTKLDELKSTVKKLTAENGETNEKLGGAEKALEDQKQDRIYQVDRRVVCDSLTQFCKVDRVLVRSLMDNLYHVGGRNRPVLQSIDSEYYNFFIFTLPLHHAQKLEILSRLADSLGFGPEEREQIGLNRSHLFHTLQNESNPVNLDADSPEDGPSQRGGASRSSQGIGTQFVEYLEKEVAEDPS